MRQFTSGSQSGCESRSCEPSRPIACMTHSGMLLCNVAGQHHMIRLVRLTTCTPKPWQAQQPLKSPGPHHYDVLILLPGNASDTIPKGAKTEDVDRQGCSEIAEAC